MQLYTWSVDKREEGEIITAFAENTVATAKINQVQLYTWSVDKREEGEIITAFAENSVATAKIYRRIYRRFLFLFLFLRTSSVRSRWCLCVSLPVCLLGRNGGECKPVQHSQHSIVCIHRKNHWRECLQRVMFPRVFWKILPISAFPVAQKFPQRCRRDIRYSVSEDNLSVFFCFLFHPPPHPQTRL